MGLDCNPPATRSFRLPRLLHLNLDGDFTVKKLVLVLIVSWLSGCTVQPVHIALAPQVPPAPINIGRNSIVKLILLDERAEKHFGYWVDRGYFAAVSRRWDTSQAIIMTSEEREGQLPWKAFFHRKRLLQPKAASETVSTDLGGSKGFQDYASNRRRVRRQLEHPNSDHPQPVPKKSQDLRSTLCAIGAQRRIDRSIPMGRGHRRKGLEGMGGGSFHSEASPSVLLKGAHRWDARAVDRDHERLCEAWGQLFYSVFHGE